MKSSGRWLRVFLLVYFLLLLLSRGQGVNKKEKKKMLFGFKCQVMDEFDHCVVFWHMVCYYEIKEKNKKKALGIEDSSRLIAGRLL